MAQVSSLYSLCSDWFEGAIAAPAKPLSVYEEAIEMLAGALTIYTFADVRAMSRKNELTTSLSDLEPPMTTTKIIDIIKANKDKLKQMAIDDVDVEKRLRALKSLNAHESSMLDGIFGQPKTARLTHFVDENDDKEMVHGIVVNDVRKRVSVIFRGSVTQQDFMIDAQCIQVKVENPVARIAESTETVNVHTGFHHYLTMANESSGKRRLDVILEDVKALLRENPGYRVYSSGHSLGGALSTLFGFYAAADDEIVKNGPVTVVSIASPLVGNMKFRLAHQTLERSKRLRHLRIANKEDLVTLMPFAAPKATAFSPVLAATKGAGNLYKHCGMMLQLRPAAAETDSQPYCIAFARDHSDDDAYTAEMNRAKEAGRSLLSSLGLMIRQDFDKIKEFHSCEEYETRLENCKDGLLKVTLDDLYGDKSIVGSVLDKDHKPQMMSSVAERASRFMSFTSDKSEEPNNRDVKVKN